jgi:hypothetical protein
LGKKFASLLVPVTLAVFLILVDGCGAYNPSGTGGGGTGGSNPGQAQGFYSCDLQSITAPTMETLILSTDVFYGMVGQLQQSSFAVSALITGQGASGNDTYSSTTLSEYLSGSGSGSSTATVSATDLPQSSMSGKITIGGAEAGFGGSALAGSLYTYSTPASIATIATTSTPWTGTLLDGSPVTLNISNTGSIVTTSSGCQVTGNVTANTSNNLFTANLTFGPSPGCASGLAGHSTSAAVGIVFFLPDGVTQELLIPATVVTTGSATVGTVFSAHK